MLKNIRNIIDFIENQSLTFSGWVISFFTLLALNLFFQFITYNFKNVSSEYFIGEIIQPYYFILYLTVVVFLYLVINQKSKIKNQKIDIKNIELINKNKKILLNILNFVLWGFWSIIFWPIIDKIILGDKFYLSFYIYDSVGGVFKSLITFFGPIIPVGILYGTRIETIFIILITGIYVYYKTESILRMIMSGVGIYIIFYVSVALPSILVFLVTIFSGGNIMAFFYKISLFYNLIFVGLLVCLQWLWDKNILKSLVKNIRIPQMIFNWGLLLLGILVGLFYVPENLTIDIFSGLVVFNLFLATLFIWIFSVVINDIEDFEVDKISNKNRPLIKNIISKKIYLNYGLIFLFLGLLLGLTVDNKIFLIISLYSLLTVVYSKYPFKLKRIPWVAGIISSLASLLIFLIGYFLITGDQAVEYFPWKMVMFLGIIYALILPIKDLKDIKSDKQKGIWTVANLLGEKWARIYFGVIIFFAFISPIYIFNISKLFLPAFFCGGVGYWIINNLKNSRDKLLYKLLALIIIYLGFIFY